MKRSKLSYEKPEMEIVRLLETETIMANISSNPAEAEEYPDEDGETGIQQ